MKRLILLAMVTGLVAGGVGCSTDRREASEAVPPLTGQIRSEAEGPMEGVLVSAKGVGSTMTVTVVSDSQGRYSFPAGLALGKYRLSIRAAGYELDDPGTVELAANGSTEVNLQPKKTENLADQLMNAEWLESVPGTAKQKKPLSGCMGCHTLARIAQSRHTAKEIVDILDRMSNYAPGSSPLHPLKRPYTVPRDPEDPEFARYLATINLSSSTDGKWKYELKSFPRPKGKATRVIITEYDLPRPDAQPHDAAVDSEGMVWYSDFGQPYMGRFNPRTGEVKEWRVPVIRPGYPEGALDIDFDSEGNVWLGMLMQAGVAKFDGKSEQFTTWSLPPDQLTPRAQTGMIGVSPDGTVWTKQTSGGKLHRLDPKTGKIETFETRDRFYGMAVGSDGNIYMSSLQDGTVGEADGKTGKVAIYQPPTRDAGSRRGHMDSQNRYWFGEFYAFRIGMFDPQTKKIQEWEIPIPWGGPYDVVPDSHGEVWGGGEHTDYVFRLHPATGEVIAYLLPRVGVNIRGIDVDRSTTPATVWFGENHQAKIGKIEPLE